MKFTIYHLPSTISKSRKGFTLIELLVVFSVFVMLSGIGLASFVSYSKSQILDQAASDVKISIERARFNAVSKVKPKECMSTEPLLSYRIEFDAASSTYTIVAVCGVGVPREVKSSKKLTQNLTFGSIGCSSIVFSTLLNQVSCSAGALPATITIGGYGLPNKNIVVDSAGNVSIN